jgi:signal transduction histidine kinase
MYAVLESVQRSLEECSSLMLSAAQLDRARARAEAVIRSGSPAAEQAGIARLVFAADLLGALVSELSDDPHEFRQLVSRLETDAGIPRLALGTAVVQSIALSRRHGLRLQLAVLTAFSGVRTSSAWVLAEGAEPECLAAAGYPGIGLGGARRLAHLVLRGGDDELATARDAVGVRLDIGAASWAAVIASGLSDAHADTQLLLRGGASAVAAVVERYQLAAQTGTHGAEAMARTERQLSRLRFDLHDGPQQDAVLLAEDMELLHSQLAAVLGEYPDRHRLLGRLEDLQARLVALDGDLRRISASLQSPFQQAELLADAIAEITASFATRTGIEPELRLTGDLADLTDSQHITLLAVIREALNNIREHSDGENVSIVVSRDRDGVIASVTDDGQGFDPERALVKAAREGHLGLVGMHERVRMLGGKTQIDSRPGGPTVISVILPAVPSIGRDERA